MTETFDLTATDGKDIHGFLWLPEGEPRYLVQVLHGMGEYAARYSDFAADLNAVGIALAAHDYRGHGEHAERRGHFGDRNGWADNLTDCLTVHNFLRERFDGKPVILFGHSLGSFFAQQFALQQSVAGMILSASTWPKKTLVYPGLLLAWIESLRLGRRGYSPALDKLGFKKFNKPYEPARTDYDWLSRDEQQVDRYVADPLCGGPFTTAFWLGALRGMLSVASDNALSRIPTDLPILIAGGGDDAVGGDKGLGNLMLHYAQTLHQRLSIKIYPGGRHEMLFETNRDQVVADLIEWMDPVAERALR